MEHSPEVLQHAKISQDILELKQDIEKLTHILQHKKRRLPVLAIFEFVLGILVLVWLIYDECLSKHKEPFKSCKYFNDYYGPYRSCLKGINSLYVILTIPMGAYTLFFYRSRLEKYPRMISYVTFYFFGLLSMIIVGFYAGLLIWTLYFVSEGCNYYYDYYDSGKFYAEMRAACDHNGIERNDLKAQYVLSILYFIFIMILMIFITRFYKSYKCNYIISRKYVNKQKLLLELEADNSKLQQGQVPPAYPNYINYAQPPMNYQPIPNQPQMEYEPPNQYVPLENNQS